MQSGGVFFSFLAVIMSLFPRSLCVCFAAHLEVQRGQGSQAIMQLQETLILPHPPPGLAVAFWNVSACSVLCQPLPFLLWPDDSRVRHP